MKKALVVKNATRPVGAGHSKPCPRARKVHELNMKSSDPYLIVNMVFCDSGSMIYQHNSHGILENSMISRLDNPCEAHELKPNSSEFSIDLTYQLNISVR